MKGRRIDGFVAVMELIVNGPRMLAVQLQPSRIDRTVTMLKIRPEQDFRGMFN